MRKPDDARVRGATSRVDDTTVGVSVAGRV
jgi:hypothetical protein